MQGKTLCFCCIWGALSCLLRVHKKSLRLCLSNQDVVESLPLAPFFSQGTLLSRFAYGSPAVYASPFQPGRERRLLALPNRPVDGTTLLSHKNDLPLYDSFLCGTTSLRDSLLPPLPPSPPPPPPTELPPGASFGVTSKGQWQYPEASLSSVLVPSRLLPSQAAKGLLLKYHGWSLFACRGGPSPYAPGTFSGRETTGVGGWERQRGGVCKDRAVPAL